jgi:hypothetical protein
VPPAPAPYFHPEVYGSDGRLLHRAVFTTRPPDVTADQWRNWSRERRQREIARVNAGQLPEGMLSAGSTDAVMPVVPDIDAAVQGGATTAALPLPAPPAAPPPGGIPSFRGVSSRSQMHHNAVSSTHPEAFTNAQ